MKNNVTKDRIPNKMPFSSAQAREVPDKNHKGAMVPTDETVEECVQWVKWKKSQEYYVFPTAFVGTGVPDGLHGKL